MKSSDILGILGGVAVGAAIGILFAPDKGTNTRKKIKDKALESKDSLEGGVSDILDTLKDKFESLKSKGEEVYADAKSNYNSEVKDLKNAVK